MTSAERAHDRPAAQRQEPQRTETSPPVRLPKGEIPRTWSRPAEQVSQIPTRAPKPLTSAFIVVGGAVVGFGLAVWLSPARQQAPQQSTSPIAVVEPAPAGPLPVAVADAAPPAAPPVDAAPMPVGAAPMPVAAIPAPPPTSSTRPSDVAPEDQGGDLVETPARAKAKHETARAKALYASGELVTAEAPLIRATLGDPSYPDAWKLLGMVRDQLGNVDGAKRAYKRYLQLAPNAPEAREVRAALAALAEAAPATPSPTGAAVD